jgi:hypothetical protein
MEEPRYLVGHYSIDHNKTKFCVDHGRPVPEREFQFKLDFPIEKVNWSTDNLLLYVVGCLSNPHQSSQLELFQSHPLVKISWLAVKSADDEEKFETIYDEVRNFKKNLKQKLHIAA